MIDWVVAPVDHVFPVALFDVKVTFPLGHNFVEDAVIDAVILLSLKTIAFVCLQEFSYYCFISL